MQGTVEGKEGLHGALSGNVAAITRVGAAGIAEEVLAVNRKAGKAMINLPSACLCLLRMAVGRLTVGSARKRLSQRA